MPARNGQVTAAASVPVETDPEVHSVLRRASSLPLLAAPELGRRTFSFYALMVGNDPDRRTAFVTQWNPHRTGLPGKILTAFGDQLRRIGQPLLVFEPLFDMVVTPMASPCCARSRSRRCSGTSRRCRRAFRFGQPTSKRPCRWTMPAATASSTSV